MIDELLKWRSEFPTLSETVYLISSSLGAMPGSVYEKIHEYAEIWTRRGVKGWEDEKIRAMFVHQTSQLIRDQLSWFPTRQFGIERTSNRQ